jgi:hypothetical protein
VVSHTANLTRSAVRAGSLAVAGGRSLAGTVAHLATRLPIRNKATLEAHFPDLSGPELADALIRGASLGTAAVGAATGAVMSVEEWLPPAWVAVPLQLLAETVAVAAIETKLIAELHEVYGRPMAGRGSERVYVLARAWAEQRGVMPAVLGGGAPALGDALGGRGGAELLWLVRRRVLRRTGANLTALGPLVVGGAAGASLNRRATRRLGQTVVDGLTSPP